MADKDLKDFKEIRLALGEGGDTQVELGLQDDEEEKKE
mgnify:CR=1 FL=1